MIRPAAPGDAAAIAAIYAHYVAAGTISFESAAPDEAGMVARMAAGGERYPWLVTVEDDMVLGYAYASRFSERDAYDWAIETTVYVDPLACGRGVGQRLYAALLEDLAARGFRHAVGRVSLPNRPSAAMHRRLGFREVGVLAGIGWKDGRWVDVAYWHRELGPGAGAPPG